ncbi:MAG TPA: hypothetical protein VKB51_02175 [bacterium]|nr:hypothetical protein [bacterium]
MNRIRRAALVASSAMATLLLTVTAPWWPGRGGQAMAQYAQSAGQSASAIPAAHGNSLDQAKASATENKDAGKDKRAELPQRRAASAANRKDKGAGTGKTAGGGAGATGLFAPFKPGGAQNQTELPPGAADLAGPSPVTRIHGEYDINELRRLIDLARDSGFTEEQLHQITVEDEHGNVVNALDFLKAYDKHKKEEAARQEAERKKVYLSPQDILNELDKEQPKDLDKLRDKMLFVD